MYLLHYNQLTRSNAARNGLVCYQNSCKYIHHRVNRNNDFTGIFEFFHTKISLTLREINKGIIMVRYKITGLFLLMIVFLVPARAGWVIMEQTKSNFGPSGFQTTFIQNNKVRFETETSIAILDLNTQQVMMIFPQYKAYWSGTAAQFRESTFEAFDTHMQAVVANAPAEDKEMYRKLYDDFKKQWKEQKSDTIMPDVRIHATGKTDTILTYVAKEYQVVVNDSVREFLWVTNEINPYDEVDYRKMVSFTQSLNPFDTEAKITATNAYLNLISKGMLLKSVEKHGVMEITTEVTMIKHVDFDEAIFEAPVGYRKAGIAEIMQMAPPEPPSLEDMGGDKQN